MPRVHTHYDNLKVSRDAPSEVIRAAYKSLAAKYHPDLHPDSEKAARIMRIINTSYEVLSDPAKRAQHDRWIANSELSAPEQAPASAEHQYEPTPWPAGSRARRRSAQAPSAATPPPFPEQPEFSAPESKPRQVLRIVALIAMVVVGFTVIESLNSPGGSRETTATPAREPTVAAVPTRRYIRPPFAPDGQPWPSASGYLTGYLPADTRGRSVLTIDNTQNGSDVCAALFEHRFEHPTPVRVFLLRAHEQFKIMNISSGSYDFRYQDLDSGATSESEVIRLEETVRTIQKDGKLYTRTEWTVMRLTLFTVPDGNMHFQTVGPEEFWNRLM